jgi:hypothetical protein
MGQLAHVEPSTSLRLDKVDKLCELLGLELVAKV